ncbi:hypothetical protein Goarm_009226 [Gossypium armourianum]|uniref:PXMP2/4 family protein 4-like n=1 Tax=Gossypium armourianum TaxID=34283 RepID=A0A7J9JSA3_9ROSI|nr:hypothetical protein [Gossypium armourianum]
MSYLNIRIHLSPDGRRKPNYEVVVGVGKPILATLLLIKTSSITTSDQAVPSVVARVPEMGSSSGNTLKSLSNRCLLRLSSDTHSLFHGKTFNEASLTTQRRGFYSFSSPNKLASCKGSHPLRSFSTSSSSSKVGFLGWYLAKLESNPIITKSVTTSLIFAAADFTSQMITSASSYDSIRTLRMAGYGLLLLGPSQHLWFNLLSKALPKRDMLTTFKKMFLGQAVFGPLLQKLSLSSETYCYHKGFKDEALVLKLYSLCITKSLVVRCENAEEIAARLKRDLLPTLISGAMFWPTCDFVTYKFVPVHLQPLMNSSCSYIWTIYLTYMASLNKVSIE